jgi:adenosylcobinamide kinase/adenosylcobinamide-phosphate guanylyltransferase
MQYCSFVVGFIVYHNGFDRTEIVMKQLILGGARSGKSQLAETLTATYGTKIAYIATTDTQYNDAEMDKRIALHRQQRPSDWCTIEEPIELAKAIQDHKHHDAIMVDCLTLWLSNCLMKDETFWQAQKHELLVTLSQTDTPIIFVSNEVGMGVVPMGKISRQFVDESGYLHQDLAKLCERVVFMAAGLPLVMKGPALP